MITHFDAIKGLFLARPAGPKGVVTPDQEPTWPGRSNDYGYGGVFLKKQPHRALDIRMFRLAR